MKSDLFFRFAEKNWLVKEELAISTWTHLIKAFIQYFVKQEPQCPIIPVILKVGKKDELPLFLGDIHWIDFDNDFNAFEKLIWGITGKK